MPLSAFLGLRPFSVFRVPTGGVRVRRVRRVLLAPDGRVFTDADGRVMTR